jgi:ABC-type sugar transport system ATPase subunit
MGYLNLCKLQLKAARQIFEEVLEEEPNNEMAKTFLGLEPSSLNPAEVKHGEKILAEAAKHSEDPVVKDLAANALDFVHKFVMKSEAPLKHHSKEK